MRFDENPPSPDKLMDVHQPDTKINVGMAIGVVVFLLTGLVFLVLNALGER